MKQKTTFLCLVLLIFLISLFSIPATASVTSQRYKEYKAKYSNKKDKNSYFKIKELKKDHPKLYWSYKSICDQYRYSSKKQFLSLNQAIQKICTQYDSYRGYQNYIYYRNKHDRNDNNDDTATTTQFNCGTDTVEDADGNSYDTVEIGEQCWMASNMNVGAVINSSSSQADNSVIEKYCYNNDPGNCASLGGLYQWNEAMQYVATEGARGICPTGWHFPSDTDLYVLENYLTDEGSSCVQERSGGGCSGAGTKLKIGGSSGLNVPFGGSVWGAYWDNYYGFLWSSTQSGGNAFYRGVVNSSWSSVERNTDTKSRPYSIRCLKD
jgi:uncharacterized protein (TIGR02145 family)